MGLTRVLFAMMNLNESGTTCTLWNGFNNKPNIIGCYVRAYEYCRTIDILIVAFIAPAAHVQMFYLRGYLYAFVAARLIYHCATFAAVAIAGIRFSFCCCVITCDLSVGVEAEDVQIRNFKHLIIDIGLNLVSILTKIVTGSFFVNWGPMLRRVGCHERGNAPQSVVSVVY